MYLSDLCTRAVVTCGRQASALELARVMRDRHVGDVVIVEDVEGGVRPVGVVTDRDLAVRVMACGIAPEHAVAEDLMHEDVHTAIGSETAYDAIWHMRSHGIRRLPVVDAHGRLVGIVTADDVADLLAQELSALARIAGRQASREQVREAGD
ncbi:CBS domain-containing protein [Aquabacterium humicola]|uniref:CBS domain-containing protein n=1 Tax=Aquabacterium humicola TaxID=3237377 RepID=UPI002543AD33|nr:CBS domain-containing protein [Rubrivivax pictus]